MTTRTAKSWKTRSELRAHPLIISSGCPRGIGPEVSVAAAARLLRTRGSRRQAIVLIGDRGVLASAARAMGEDPAFVLEAPEHSLSGGPPRAGLSLVDPGHGLSTARSRAGKPRPEDGRAQLEYVELGYELSRRHRGALVTGPVSKEVIAGCGLRRAARFLGHTEWLEALDGAEYSVMCFWSARLSCSLVTTHLPIARLSRSVDAPGVERATLELAHLLQSVGCQRPHLAVASLNPHGGEGELLGREEGQSIVPGMRRAQKRLGRRALITGPVGAETAFRKAAAGGYDGVVAMYHDQATIPMKLLSFGDAVNVTQGLSIVRTSVDHGTGYDIAMRGIADSNGMLAALRLGLRLAQARAS